MWYVIYQLIKILSCVELTVDVCIILIAIFNPCIFVRELLFAIVFHNFTVRWIWKCHDWLWSIQFTVVAATALTTNSFGIYEPTVDILLQGSEVIPPMQMIIPLSPLLSLSVSPLSFPFCPPSPFSFLFLLCLRSRNF